MAIAVASLIAEVEFLLDTASSDRYTYGRDYAPAIQMTQDALTGVMGSLIDQKKFSSELMRDLNITSVFTASTFGRIFFTDVPKVWSILAVYPECTITGTTGAGPLLAYQSRFEREAAYVGSSHSARRLTQEEWNEGQDNIFLPGNTVMGGAQKRYAYFWASNMSAPPNYVPGGPEMMISPIPPSPRLVAVAYLRIPEKLVFDADDIAPPAGLLLPFPEQMEPIFVDQMYRYISFQQGDGTNAYSVATDDLRKQLLSVA